MADESTPFAFDATPAIASGTRMYADLEQWLFSAPAPEGLALRFGFLYGPGTWYAVDGDVADLVRQRQFLIVGDGSAVWSWVHVDDAAAAVVAAIAQGEPGAYNIVDDQPVELRQWLPAFAKWLGAEPPVRVSTEDALQNQGADAVYYATHLRGASNRKAKQVLGWRGRSLEWLAASPSEEVATVISMPSLGIAQSL